MIKISNIHETLIAGAIFFVCAFMFLICMADLSYGQNSLQTDTILQLAKNSGSFAIEAKNYDLAAAHEPVKPSISAKPQEEKQKLVAELRERIVLQIKNNWARPSKVDDAIAAELGRAYKEGVLEPTIVAILGDPRLQKFFPPGAKGDPAEIARIFSMYVGAELESNGFVEGVQPLEQWDELTERYLKLAKNSAYQTRRRGQSSLLAESGFISELASIQGTPFSSANKILPLNTGPESFSKRDELMKGAKKSIYLTTWALLDDETGHHTVDILIAKKKEGLDVRLMLDADTMKLYDKGIVAKVEAAGIPVVKYQPKAKPYYEFHSKILIVDGASAILGGMNIGNEYSHMAGDQKWRDTDVLVQGPVMKDAMRFFSEVWNSQVEDQRLRFPRADKFAYSSSGAGYARAAIVWNAPGEEPYIFLSMLKAVYGATERINIENAILVMMPAMEQALLDARARGVEVNILSNSLETIGDSMMSSIILSGFPKLMQAGATVYLKQGGLPNRLHSKFMTVDGAYGTIGSFNLQPRSIRYVMEVAVNFTERGAVASLDNAFKQDMALAKKVNTVKDLNIPFVPIRKLIRKYMFNQL